LLKHHQTNNIFFSYFLLFCLLCDKPRLILLLLPYIMANYDVLFFYVMATHVCICIIYFKATHNYFYSVYFMANHDCFHCVTLFTLWPIMIVFTVSLCLRYGQSWLFSLCHFVYSMANQDCFHCVTLFTLWPTRIVFTVSLCLLCGQPGLFFALVTLWPICLCSLSCTQYCLCFWTVHPFLTLRFSLTLYSSF
jgi:hypothetical protein